MMIKVIFHIFYTRIIPNASGDIGISLVKKCLLKPFFCNCKMRLFLHFLNSVKTTQKLNSPLNSGQGKSLLALLLNNMCPMKTNSSLSTSVSIHTLSYTPLFPQEESLMYIEVPTRFLSLMLYSRYFLLKSQSYQGSPSKEIRK